MMKGFPSQQRNQGPINGYSQEQSETSSQHNTIQDIGSGKHAIDNLPKLAYDVSGADDTAEALSTGRLLIATAHGAREGDFIRFLSGSLDRVEIGVKTVINAMFLRIVLYSPA